jgi:Domain of unknown function (DUF4304)
MTAQAAFDAMLTELIWPLLREWGFRRTKATFHRSAGPNWEVVNLQRSVSSDARQVRFTVNLAIGLDRLRDGLHDWPDGKRPAEPRCHLRQRLGSLMCGEDVWWRLGSDTDLLMLANAVSLAIQRHGLPWLQAHSTEEALLRLLEDPQKRGEENNVLHLKRYETLLAQLGKEELRATVAAHRRQQEAAGERHHQAITRALREGA